MYEKIISIKEILVTLRIHWKIIIIITLCSTLIATFFTFFIVTPKYEAKTKVFIGKQEGSNESYNQSDVEMYQKLMSTYSELIKTKDLISTALDTVDTDISVEEVLDNLSVVNVIDTQILQIKLIGEDPIEARNVVAAITNEFISKATNLVKNSNISIVEKVTIPQKPVIPNKKFNIIIAFLLGSVGSIGLSFILEYLDNTFKNKEQVEEELKIPVIGVIPIEELKNLKS